MAAGESHPTWVRGLKSQRRGVPRPERVAPHVGAWIEIEAPSERRQTYGVAPHVGAWIEIRPMTRSGIQGKSHPTWVRGLKLTLDGLTGVNPVSHPTWVRGLKFPVRLVPLRLVSVAPHVGAWIEIC